MKYIEVTGWGNKRKHLIPLNKITHFGFEENHTTISFTNGNNLNVIEDEITIREMLGFHGANIVSEHILNHMTSEREMWSEYNSGFYHNEGIDEDELPF